MQQFSNDKPVRKDTVEDLKGFNQQSLTTQTKERTISINDACY